MAENLPDTNVGNIEYIRKEDAIKQCGFGMTSLHIADNLRRMQPADVIPYSFASDGTLTITVPKGTYKKVNRVLVQEDGTHYGGLYYAD